MGKISSPQRSESQHHLRHPAISYPTCEVSSGRFDPNFSTIFWHCWDAETLTIDGIQLNIHKLLEADLPEKEHVWNWHPGFPLQVLTRPAPTSAPTKMLRFPGPGFFRRWQLQVTKHNLKSSTSVDLFWKDVGSTGSMFHWVICCTVWGDVFKDFLSRLGTQGAS